MLRLALTIAGSDSGGGAGIQADLKTFHAFGCFGTSAITAITAQNTLGVRAVQAIEPLVVRQQIEAVVEDFSVGAAKTGMLFSAAIIAEVRDVLESLHPRLPLVVDPVMVASSGDRLLESSAEAALSDFLSIATLVTPNIPEAELLTGRKIHSIEDMKEAAAALRARTGAAVLLKGGHRAAHSDVVTDVFFDGDYTLLEAPLVPARNTHGTGCTLSAGIAAGLAKGLGLLDSVKQSKEFLKGALANAPGFGKGIGPLNHLWNAGRAQE
jgi:hydroxymethylpyrimidine/phosphomethylpyrimidine kinase